MYIKKTNYDINYTICLLLAIHIKSISHGASLVAVGGFVKRARQVA